MNMTVQRGRGAASILWILAIIVAVTLIVAAYMVLGPHPTDFAGGKRVPLAEYRASNPTGAPAELRSAILVKRGEYLTRAADCLVCHTSQDGEQFAGGRAFILPFGTIYSTNITPDAQTGIGNYTDANFLDALHGASAAVTPDCIRPCRMPATPT
jgi:hypothetical protein